jgi:hypothetical protein
MKRFVLFVLVAGLVLAVGSAWAATVTVIDFKTGSILSGSGSGTIGNGGWSVQKQGDPWWDNNSSDPANKNIGDMLLGAIEPAFTPQSLASPPGALPYLYGTNTATAVTDWVFQDGVGAAVLKLELAGNRNVNKLGIYKAGDPNTKITLFPGPVSPIATKPFSIPAAWGGKFGLFIQFNDANAPIFYTESSLNTSGDEFYQHFALFKGATNQYGFVQWWIGVEDLPYASNPNEGNPNNGNRGDFQDMVLTIEAVPDASAWMLFLSGVPALALLRRKRA